jgi:hypothetical protein
MYRKPLAVEQGLLERFRRGEDGARWCRDYRTFLEVAGSIYGSSPARLRRGALYSGAARLLSEESLDRYRRDPRRRPACLVTAYYGNVYFGLKQSLVLDSLRAAIEDLGGRGALAERKRVHYLSALLHAASTSTSGTSHFAQPRHLRKSTELAAMATRRLVDIFERFEACSRDILDTVRRTDHVSGNRCFASDFHSLIVDPGPAGSGGRPALPRFDFPGGIDLVYFDPPYTADNYSRFYHVLEVIARYDYPRLQRDPHGKVVRGRYPILQSRFQSGFCRKTRVEDEFRRVIAATAGSRAGLIISYAAPTGLLIKQYAKRFPGSDPVERLEALCREYFGDVETRRLRMLHSGQGDSNLSVDELLVICRKPR